ncbi:Heavy metal RND efflux outer membrane protein, CzcC family [hydrothermal vent metagenome]|uniref:Heavy metal RND efflux outer membrane protein, CzcC family n=1 Tax=hydrothermal vent metagenome TaxID=652676 RepID=A0A3B0VP74_9ZZZZ
MNKRRLYILALPLLVVIFFPRYAAAEDIRSYTLSDLMNIAVQKNPSVAAFKANLAAARGVVISAGAYPNPELEFMKGRGEALDGSESRNEYSISIGQPIEWPGKRSFRKKAAVAALEARQYDSESFMLELRYKVKAAFYALLYNRKGLGVSAKNLETVNALLNTVRTRVEAGESPGFELVKARVEALKSAKELKKARKKVVKAGILLNSLLGNALPDKFNIEGRFTIPQEKYDREELLSTALKNHPAIKQRKKDLEALGYAFERERRSILPDVTVKGYFDRELDKESYGMGVSMPLPLLYRRKGEIQTARGELRRAEAELLGAKIEISRAIEDAYSNLEIALEETRVFEEGLLEQAQEALEISEFSYREGKSGLLVYLDAQRIHREIQLDYNMARFELSLSVADIERLVGGI